MTCPRCRYGTAAPFLCRPCARWSAKAEAVAVLAAAPPASVVRPVAALR